MLSSGGALVVGQVVTSLTTLLSALVYSRAIGPREFGVYAFCVSMSGVLRAVSRMGANARLLTRIGEPSTQQYDVALTMMLSASVASGSIVVFLIPYIERISNISSLFWPTIIAIILVPVHVFSLPAIARLERRLEFRRITRIEISSHFIGASAGIGFTICNFGIWGPLVGWVVRELTLTAQAWGAIESRPHLRWHKRLVFGMAKYGLKYTFAVALVQARSYLLLIMIGRFFDQDAVGYMALCNRVVGLISPLRTATSRVVFASIASLSRRTRFLTDTISDAIQIELLLSIPISIVCVWCWEPSVRLLLGRAWLPTESYFPWVASAAIIAALNGSSLTVLHARGFFTKSIISSLVVCLAYSTATLVLAYLKIHPCAISVVLAWPAFLLQDYFYRSAFSIRLNWYSIVWAVAGVLGCLSWIYGLPLLLLSGSIILLTRKELLLRISSITSRNAGQN